MPFPSPARSPRLFSLAFLAILGSASLSACVVDEYTESEESAEMFNGGQPTLLRTAVGVMRDDDSLCSATLIAPRLILTAAHCLGSLDTFAVTLPSGRVITREVTHYLRHEAFDDDNKGRKNYVNDIMLGLLDREITQVTPMKIATSPVAPGEFVEWVGYGVSDVSAKDSGIKRMMLGLTDPLEEYAYAFFTTISFETPAGCFGDSGGAAIRWINGDMYLAGIISHGFDECSTVTAVRTDFHIEWITRAILSAKRTMDQQEESQPSE